MFRKIITDILRGIASAILRKFNPTIVAITGSVGKSTTKEAIFHILNSKFEVRKSDGNFNTEIGVPLTIIGSGTGGRNILKWLGIFAKGLMVLAGTKYPKILVLEMGADRPGELYRLTAFAKPHISVVTSVGISHLEFFKTREAIKHEKAALVRALGENDVAILNADDEGASSLRSETKGKVLTYGFSNDANFKAEDAEIEKIGESTGTGFDIVFQGQKQKVILERSLGEPTVYAVLAGLAVAQVLGVNLEESASVASNFYGLAGRLKVVKGIKDTTIIDDTYNSAPLSAIAALKVLKSFPGGRKIAVMGRMAELGEESETGHRQVGVEVANLGIDLLLVKDNEAAWIGEEAEKVGFNPDKVMKFSESSGAADKLKNLIQPGDVILFKASRADAFEEIFEGMVEKK